jgi:hypothetical protein
MQTATTTSWSLTPPQHEIVRHMADKMREMACNGIAVDRQSLRLHGFTNSEIDRYGEEVADCATAESVRQGGAGTNNGAAMGAQGAHGAIRKLRGILSCGVEQRLPGCSQDGRSGRSDFRSRGGDRQLRRCAEAGRPHQRQDDARLCPQRRSRQQPWGRQSAGKTEAVKRL